MGFNSGFKGLTCILTYLDLWPSAYNSQEFGSIQVVMAFLSHLVGCTVYLLVIDYFFGKFFSFNKGSLQTDVSRLRTL